MEEVIMDVLDKIDRVICEVKKMSTPMVCIECRRKFKKIIGPKTFEVKCPKCGSYDTEPE